MMSHGCSARIAEVAAMSDVVFCKRFKSSYESSPSPSPTLPVRKSLNVGDESHELNNESRELEDKSHGLDDEGHRVESGVIGLAKEATPEGQQRAAPVVETAVSEPLRLRYGALRRRELALEEDRIHSTFEHALTTWTDLEDSTVYIDVPTYPPPAPPVQTPLSPEWSSGSLPISPAPSTVPSPISSPTIPLTVPSPVATPTTTILVDEDQILEHEQERTAMTFRALWRLVLDLLVQQADLRHELQEMRDHVTALEQERDSKEQ
ncbi:hypothetical protein Tco_0738702 [Tanacetum coccineum]